MGSVLCKRSLDSPTDVFYETKSVLDIDGNLLELIDAKGRSAMRYDYDMLGRVLKQTSIDAGTRHLFATAAGQPVRSWGERGFTHRSEYDALRRPTHVFMDDGLYEILVERLFYGEAHPDAATKNLNGRLVHHYDQSGVRISDDFDFKGNLLTQTKYLIDDYVDDVDWSDIETEDDPTDALRWQRR